MAKIGRPGLPSDRRQQVWEMWKAGSSISEISREVGSPPGSIFSILLPFGGIYQAPQRRRAGCLTLSEREEISRGIAGGESIRAIARRLERAPSTISRELSKNKGVKRYRAVDAEDRAWRRARRPQRCYLASNPVLRRYVASRLREFWSPEQIAGALKLRFPRGHRMRISHETIYKSMFVQSRGVLPKDLQQSLRARRPIRRSVHNSVSGQWCSQIINATPIAERPKHVQQPPGLRRSLTWDRGMELAGHAEITARTGMRVSFADPHSPWQRGTNENTNGLLRQFMPKGTTMKNLTQDDLDLIAAQLNNRPRKRLG